MVINAALAPAEISNYDLRGKIAVVIDVLRFNTAVSAAFEAGVEKFCPVREPAQALALKKKNPGLLLAGERQALRIPGFDFGNSPLEHLGQDHRGKRIVFCTTNGTQAIHQAASAKMVVLGSIRTAKAVAKYLRDQNQPVLFLPAGNQGRFSLEDAWCAGLILSYLSAVNLGDGALAVQSIFHNIALSDLENSEHARTLARSGFQSDLRFCLECNVSSCVIIWNSESGWGSLV